MPTYEYECLKCGHVFERFQSIKDPPVSRCPSCKGKVRKLISSGAGIIFKGSGFYQTDYRSESYRKGEKAEKSSASSSSAPSTPSAEAKPASKPAKS